MGIKEVLSDMTREISRNRRRASDNQRMTTNGPFLAGRASPKTIAAGAIEVTRPHVVVLPESGIADNLDTISNFADGKFIIVATSDPAHTITVRDESISGGNIRLSGGATTAVLSDPEETLLLIYKDDLDLWVQTGATASGGGAPALHASTHQHGGTDEVATATPAANAIVKAAGTGKIANGWLDATLESIAALGTVADRIAYTTGVDTWAETSLTAFARTILDDADQAAVQVTLALVPGTNVQAFDVELAAIAGLTSAADRVPYFTGSGTAALATFTAYGRSLVAAVDAAAFAVILATAIDGTSDLGAPADTDQIPAIRAGGFGTILWSAMKTALTTLFNTIYIVAAGVAGGQTWIGGTAASENATIESTAHATKGRIKILDGLELGRGTVSAFMLINGAAGSVRDIQFQTAGSARIIYRVTSTAESGSNEGSDFTITTRADDGSSLDAAAFALKRSNSFLGLGTVIPEAKLHVILPDAVTNAIVNAQILSHTSSGTPAAGFGIGFLARLKSSTTTAMPAGRLTWEWITATHASRASKGSLSAYLIGAEVVGLTWDSAGLVQVPGTLNVDGAATFNAATTVKPGAASDTAKVGGVLFVSTTAAGNVGTGEDDLVNFSVPANTLSVNNQSVWMIASGKCANNANAKRLRARFGTAGTSLILDDSSIDVSVVINWEIEIHVYRTGAATQKAHARFSFTKIGFSSPGGQVAVVTTLDQTLSGAVAFKLTGEATANNDITVETVKIGWDGENT